MSIESEPRENVQEEGEEYNKVGVTHRDGTFEKVDPSKTKKEKGEDWREQK